MLLDTSAVAGQDTPLALDDGTMTNAAPMSNVATTPAPATDTQQSAVAAPSQANADTVTAAPTAPVAATPLPTDQADVTTPATDPNALVMNFVADC